MRKLTTLLLCAALLALASCGEQSDIEQGANDTGESSVQRVNILGELTYRQRIALPPDASATVALLELAKGGDNTETSVVTEVQLSDFKQVPIAFSLTYPSDAILPDSTYRLRAQIHDKQGKLLWRSSAAQSIDPLNDGGKLTIVMQQVDGAVQNLSYQCEDRKFDVAVTPGMATLTVNNHIVALPSVRSASGAKYSDGNTVFWSKGMQQVLVVVDGKTYKNCRVAD